MGKALKKFFNNYWWLFNITYLVLGAFNIVFAWLGLICFCTPLFYALVFGTKGSCNGHCARGQLLDFLGNKCKLSTQRPTPKILRHPAFRYFFMIFFFAVFIATIIMTVWVAHGVRSVDNFIVLFWTFKLPWAWASTDIVPAWVVQFGYGFYGILLTATLVAVIMMVAFKPRTWCVFCPMGTLCQLICKARNGKKAKAEEEKLAAEQMAKDPAEEEKKPDDEGKTWKDMIS